MKNYLTLAGCFCFALGCCYPLKAQTTSTWSLAGNGTWANAANWDTPHYPDDGQPNPGDTYNAILNTNWTITLDQDIAIQAFTQSTGTVTGTAARTLAINHGLNWAAGVLAGGMTVDLLGNSTISSASNHSMLGGTIVNHGGTLSWNGGDIGGDSGASWTFINNSAGVMNVALTSDASIGHHSPGSQTFSNAGTIHINTSGGASVVTRSVFNNSGSVNLNSGNLFIVGGGINSGNITLSSGLTTLVVGNNPLTQTATGSISGNGNVTGTYGSSVIFNADSTYNINGNTTLIAIDMVFNNHATTGNLSFHTAGAGRLFGSGSLTVTGHFDWYGSGGWPSYNTGLHGLNVIVQGSMSMHNGTHYMLGGAQVQNFGNATWSAGDLSMKPSGGSETTRFTNATGGSLNLQFDALIEGGGTTTTNFFTNNGTFTKSGGVGTAKFDVVTHNLAAGTMNIHNGTLSLWQTTNNGTINVGNNATLTFHTHFTAPTFTQNAGSLLLHGGTVSNSLATLNIAGGTLGGNGIITGNVSLTTGILSPGNSAGNLTISNDLSVSSATIWNIEIGGTVQGVDYDFLSEGGFSAFDVNNSFLQVGLLGSFTPDSMDTFTIFSSNSAILGTFGNLDGLGRVNFAEGSFLVNISGNDIILSNFVAIPEPHTATLVFAATLAGLALARKNRRSRPVRSS